MEEARIILAFETLKFLVNNSSEISYYERAFFKKTVDDLFM